MKPCLSSHQDDSNLFFYHQSALTEQPLQRSATHLRKPPSLTPRPPYGVGRAAVRHVSRAERRETEFARSSLSGTASDRFVMTGAAAALQLVPGTALRRSKSQVATSWS